MGQEKQSWLRNVFDSEYFVFWMALTCLSRYKEKEIHQYLCYKIYQTKREEAVLYYPQLFHLMLAEEGQLWNRPIFRLLYKISRSNRHFMSALAMYSVSVSDSYRIDQEKEKTKYGICLEFARIISHVSYPCVKPRHHITKETLYTKYLRMTYGSKVGMSPSAAHMLSQQKQFYSLPESPTRRKKEPEYSVKSAIASLLSGIAAVSDTVQHKYLVDVSLCNRVYHKKRVIYKNQAEKIEATIAKNSKENSFIERLNTISTSLISIPRHMREQAFITEINLLNLYLPDNICLSMFCPGSSHTSILSISAELSKTLDSATRAPFMLVYEAANESAWENRSQSADSLMSYEKYSGDTKDKKQETKERVFKTAIKILGGLKELDSSSHVDMDILSIKTRVIKKIYSMHTPQYTTPTNIKYADEWSAAVNEVKKKSIYREMDGWRMNSLIIKTGSDMKQEQLASQILGVIESIWKQEKTGLFLNAYKTMVTGRDSGIIETIQGAKSIHQIKKHLKERGAAQNIMEYFIENWKDKIDEARETFFKSLVAYSLVSYILQIKDRHNGNILIGSKGELFHIDFGFVLGSHPGFYSVESAPFKFSIEYAEVAGEERMSRFKSEFLKGFLSLRKNMDHIIILVESVAKSGGILSITQNSVYTLRERFQPGLTIQEFSENVSDIVDRGMKNVFTDIYDSLQYYTQGYCK
ncbi:phosphatidylinositol 4-kinase B [Nematocida sp. AWRm78]|nr:phosphatidylinositol 4-kinase B [Nematocida sp. AWRm79]KAI5183391.1 phosphatidylinositol 4-kinase B [Nematocida sp. AWRm78]